MARDLVQWNSKMGFFESNLSLRSFWPLLVFFLKCKTKHYVNFGFWK